MYIYSILVQDIFSSQAKLRLNPIFENYMHETIIELNVLRNCKHLFRYRYFRNNVTILDSIP